MSTTLAQANKLLRQRRYTDALALYARVMQECPELAHVIKFNAWHAERRQQLWPEGEGHCVKSLDLPTHSHVNQHRDEHLMLGGYTINVAHQAVINSINANHWESLGEDPYFLLEPKQIFTCTKAWYCLTLVMHSTKKSCMAKLYLDNGEGFNEIDTVTLTLKDGESTSRVFWLETLPRNLRFDPKEGAGQFQIESIHIEAVSDESARIKMLHRLVEASEEFASHTPETAWEEIHAQSRNERMSILKYLYRLYNETFKIRPQTIAYQEWIATVEMPSLPAPVAVRNAINSMGRKPLISIVMPVYDTPAVYLRASIEAVLAQSYPHWELCIADDKSPEENVRQILREYEQKDSRIRVVYREKNGHISRASNSALEMAAGNFVALLDHDDVLAQHALYFMAQATNECPDAQIFYSDEDKIDSSGNRFSPHFKTDWNPDLLYGQNYICHLVVFRRELLYRIGGFRPGVEGSQDHDLLLRCLPHVRADEIIHIPRVLYHWRVFEGSTAHDPGAKSYTSEASIKALKDHFSESGPPGVHVEAGLLPNTYRVRWPVPQPAPLVSLLIPTRDRKPMTEVAVRSILDKTIYPNYEIIILDNGSVEEEALKWFECIQAEEKRVRVVRYDHPFNFSAINNFGVGHAMGSIIGLINNDVEVISPEWLTEMVGHASRGEIGCVGAKLYYSNNTLQHAGVILGIGGVAGHSHKYFDRQQNGYFGRLKLSQNLSAVTAACLVVRREIYEAVGGLNEEDLRVAFNDVDFCLKVRQAGYRNLWTPYAELYHHESLSRGAEDTPEKQERFRKEIEFMQSRWGEALQHDPYYSPNLTSDREDFSLMVLV